MTFAEYLRAVGPHTKAWAEGWAEGRGEAAVRILIRQLTRKFGPVPDTVRERINAASIEQLDVWCERVLDAERLDEVFG
jgi:hypothetical protein